MTQFYVTLGRRNFGGSSLLGYKPKSLSYVIYKMPVKYKTFTVPKKSGGVRTMIAL